MSVLSPCTYSAHRLGIPCRFCEPSRFRRHEATCRGLLDWWHTLTGEHVRISVWDWQEAVFMCDRAVARLDRLDSQKGKRP